MRRSWLVLACAGCVELDRGLILTLEPGVWACEPGAMDEVLPLLEEPVLSEGELEIRVVREESHHLLFDDQDIVGERFGSALSFLSLSFPLVRADAPDRVAWMRETLYLHRPDQDDPSASYHLSQHRRVPTSSCEDPPCSELRECRWEAEATLAELP
jgi:hypothetical protein